jgi:hypothetical protein
MAKRTLIVPAAVVLAGCFGAVSTIGTRDTAEQDPLDDALDVVETVEDPVEDPAPPDVVPDEGDANVDCTELVWYQDRDHDGFGGFDMTYTGCEPPPGYVDVGGDCADDEFDVHPGQYAFFTEPYGEGAWDYNCDGAIEPEYPDTHDCSILNCIDGEGWSGPAVAPCGERAAWVECRLWGPVCNYQPGWHTQGCR